MSDITGTDAESALRMAKLGAFPGGIGQLSTAPATGAELVSPSRVKEQGIPLAEASAAASNPGKFTQQDQTKVVGVTFDADGVPKVTTTTTTTTGSYKFSDPKVLAFAREKLLKKFGKQIDGSTISVGQDGVTRATMIDADGNRSKVKFLPEVMFDGTD